MKKLVLAFLIFTLTFISCKTNKPTSSTTIKETKDVVVEAQTKEKTTPVETKDNSTVETHSKDNLITKGKNLFYEKTCAACHAKNERVIGPSIKEIALVYKEKKGNIIKYLKGNADAIVDTNPAQVAIMKANIDAIGKNISHEDIQAIEAYIYSIK